MRLYKLFFLWLLSLILFSSCSSFQRKQNIFKRASLPMVQNKFVPLILWSSTVGEGTRDFYSNLRPDFSKNVVYAADRKGTVCALNTKNGKKIWSINLAEKSGRFLYSHALLSGGITVSGKHAYIGSEKAQVYALDTTYGVIVWKTRVSGEVLSRPVVSDGMVLIHTSNGQIQALNEVDGRIKWTISLETKFFSLRGESAPATAFGMAIVGGDNGRVSAILIHRGKIIWQQTISHNMLGETEIDRLNDVDVTPVIVDSTVYVLAYNGDMTALNLHNGQIIWKRKLGAVNDFIVNGHTIYLVDQNDRLLALNTENGVTKWQQNSLLHRFLTAPSLFNNNLVVGDKEGYIHWINPETGYFVARKKIDYSGFLSRPVVTDDSLLIQAKNGKLYAIKC